MRYTLLIFSFLAFFLTSCEEEDKLSKDIKDFYYPVEDLEEGLVYEFEASNDSFPTFYWYFRNVRDTSGLYLVSTYYDFNFTPYNLAREKVLHNGVRLVDSYLYEPDSVDNTKQQQIPVEILAGNVFPFEVKKENSGVLLYKVRYQEIRDSAQITLIKNRQYIGDTTYVYQGKSYDAVQFYVRELIDNFKDGHLEHEFDGLEIYAKDLGLVYFKREIAKDFILEYALKERYPMQKLEEKFKVSLDTKME